MTSYEFEVYGQRSGTTGRIVVVADDFGAAREAAAEYVAHHRFCGHVGYRINESEEECEAVTLREGRPEIVHFDNGEEG